MTKSRSFGACDSCKKEDHLEMERVNGKDEFYCDGCLCDYSYHVDQQISERKERDITNKLEKEKQ